MIDLILGGTKSGKSDFALELLTNAPAPWTMIATGKSRDLGFRAQIQNHRSSRDPRIFVREINTNLPAALNDPSLAGSILVDSLDFWLFSILDAYAHPKQESCFQALFQALRYWNKGRLILVSTEMGLGPLAFDGQVRAFARSLGQLNQKIASLSSSVYLVMAGLPHQLK